MFAQSYQQLSMSGWLKQHNKHLRWFHNGIYYISHSSRYSPPKNHMWSGTFLNHVQFVLFSYDALTESLIFSPKFDLKI